MDSSIPAYAMTRYTTAESEKHNTCRCASTGHKLLTQQHFARYTIHASCCIRKTCVLVTYAYLNKHNQLTMYIGTYAMYLGNVSHVETVCLLYKMQLLTLQGKTLFQGNDVQEDKSPRHIRQHPRLNGKPLGNKRL